jgi:hypothetical protein
MVVYMNGNGNAVVMIAADTPPGDGKWGSGMKDRE